MIVLCFTDGDHNETIRETISSCVAVIADRSASVRPIRYSYKMQTVVCTYLQFWTEVCFRRWKSVV